LAVNRPKLLTVASASFFKFWTQCPAARLLQDPGHHS
jgi:hypothetical protein